VFEFELIFCYQVVRKAYPVFFMAIYIYIYIYIYIFIKLIRKISARHSNVYIY
jgi:hypothetical protein